jgi:transglutaminase-like putative cysteine protease
MFCGAALVFLGVYANEAAFCEMLGFPAETSFLLICAGAFSLIAFGILAAPRPLALVFVPTVLLSAVFFLFRESLGYDVIRAYNCLGSSSVLQRFLPAASLPSDDVIGAGRWLPLLLSFIWGILLLLHLADGRNCFWYTVFDVVIFCAAAVLMNTLPSARTTVLFAALHAALNLTSALLLRDKPSAGKAALFLIPCALLFCLGCWALLPLYERPALADRAVEETVSLWNRLTKRTQTGRNGNAADEASLDAEAVGTLDAVTGAFPWNSRPDEVRLDDVGPREPISTVVMEVYSDNSRTLYLRGISYGVYAPESWTQFPQATYTANMGVFRNANLLTSDAAPTEELRIRTASSDIFWLPYTPTELPPRSSIVGDSYVAGSARTGSGYNVLFYPNAVFAPVSWAYYRFVFGEYLQVPDETKEALEPILGSFDAEDPNLVFRIADYVRNCAAYDTDTPAMPFGADFVPWFLLESDRGYCVHFASAAAVLLRCMGVPARYVTGYMIPAEGGRWNPVTEDDAHAWVEYFDDSQASWRMLEVTSSLSFPEEEEETETTAPAAPLPNLREETPDRPEPERTQSAPVSQTAPKKRGISLFRLIPVFVLPLLAGWPVCRAQARKRALKKADPNRRAVLTYRLIRSYSAASRIPPGEKDAQRAQEIAEKARFSRHTISTEEQAELDGTRSAAEASLRRDRNPVRRMWNRWFYGV